MRIQNIFKTIFSSPLLIVAFFRKAKFDNFVGGLIFGAIFSLVVNIATVQLQETITKQRYYEAIEQEMITHYLKASNVIDLNRKLINGEIKETFLTSYPYTYSQTFWDEGDAIAYIQQLDPIAQGRITTYYSTTVDFANVFINQYRQTYLDLDSDYQKCSYIEVSKSTSCTGLKNARDAAYRSFESAQYGAAKQLYNTYLDARQVFHPTQDRLESPILRILMGEKAMPILKKPVNNLESLKLK